MVFLAINSWFWFPFFWWDRWYIITQLAIYTTYSPCLLGGYIVTYHLLWELETPVDVTLDKTQESKAKVSILVYMWRTYLENIWTNATMNENLPTYPWNKPQAQNQQFMKEFLSFGGLGRPGVCETGVCWGSLRMNHQNDDHRLTIIYCTWFSNWVYPSPISHWYPSTSRNDIGRASAEVETMTRSFIILLCFCEKKHSTCEKWGP